MYIYVCVCVSALLNGETCFAAPACAMFNPGEIFNLPWPGQCFSRRRLSDLTREAEGNTSQKLRENEGKRERTSNIAEQNEGANKTRTRSAAAEAWHRL